MAKNADQEFVEFVVKSLVNVPDEVSSTRTVDEMGVLITLKVNPQDMGVIIGKQGATARALRTLLRVVGAKNNARVNLKIEEPAGSERAPRPERTQSVDDVVDNLKL
ncbi:MAG: KH domain-containing protein [Parcubacteria group bacterium]|nr:KH domain-containing protein [Parcubacteria group bacterium]